VLQTFESSCSAAHLVENLAPWLMTGGPNRRMSQKTAVPGSQAQPVQKEKKAKKEKKEAKAAKEADREKSDRKVSFAPPSEPEKKRDKKTKTKGTSEVPSPSVHVPEVQEAAVKAEHKKKRRAPESLPPPPAVVP